MTGPSLLIPLPVWWGSFLERYNEIIPWLQPLVLCWCVVGEVGKEEQYAMGLLTKGQG